jgi:hypothetical protein
MTIMVNFRSGLRQDANSRARKKVIEPLVVACNMSQTVPAPQNILSSYTLLQATQLGPGGMVVVVRFI